MAIEAGFLDLMPDTVTVYAQSAVDKYGKRSHAASGTTYSARIQPASKMVRDAEGREVEVVGMIYLHGAPTLEVGHKVVLPDGSTPLVVGIRVVRDESGPHHTVIEVGR